MERLQKILAQAGIASRRKCEELIESGRVSVDGVVQTELGSKADSTKQRIEVDGKPISLERKICVILNKPTSYVTTVTDPEGRRTVMELLQDIPERLYPVGRLDYDTSGLLLFSNDGDLTHSLLHPSHELEKVYRVTILGMPERDVLQQLRTGIQLEDGPTQPTNVRTLRNHPRESVLEVTIREGRNRQIRRMFDAVGFPVKRLKRVEFGPLSLVGLASGKWRKLTEEEWGHLYSSANLTAPPYPWEKPKKTFHNTKTGRPVRKEGQSSRHQGREDGTRAGARQRSRGSSRQG